MSYNNAIPQSTDLISNSQAQILGNFASIDSGTTGTGVGFSRNHVTMTDGTNGGLHNEIDFYQALSSPTISGFVGALYPKTVTNDELFFKNGTQDMQMSNSTLTASSGQGMLPGGLQIRSAVISGALQINPVVFSSDFPNACIAVVCTADTSTSVSLTVQNLTKHQFNFSRGGGGSTTFYYIAVGY